VRHHGVGDAQPVLGAPFPSLPCRRPHVRMCVVGESKTYGAAYRRAVTRQLAVLGPAGARAAVGGHFEAIGALERAAVEAESLPADGWLIDIGCGAGRLATTLRDWAHLRYLGIDVSPQLLEHARAATRRPDWRFELVKGPVIPAPDAVADVVAMFSVITHLAEQDTRAYFSEIARVLKPGGSAVVSFLDPTIPAHRTQIRPAWLEAIVTRIAWAPNVATPVESLHAWATAAGLNVARIESPAPIGQSVVVLRRATA
jgi:SAM-dependent methyltransferase